MTKELITTGNGLLASNTTLTTANENSALEEKQTPLANEKVTKLPTANQDAALKTSTNEIVAEKPLANQEEAALKSLANHDVTLKMPANEMVADAFVSDVKSSKQWNHEIRDQKFRELIKDERPLNNPTSEATKEDPAARRSNTKRKSPFPASALINRAKKPVVGSPPAAVTAAAVGRAMKKKKQPMELSGIKKAIVLELKKTAEQFINGNNAAGIAYPYYNNNMQRYG